MSEALKPCPFCGSKAAFAACNGDTWSADCRSCCCQTAIYQTQEEAAQRWNKRVGEGERVEKPQESACNQGPADQAVPATPPACVKCGHDEPLHVGKPRFCSSPECLCPGYTPPAVKLPEELLAGESCCDNEQRSMNGGCISCGSPSF